MKLTERWPVLKARAGPWIALGMICAGAAALGALVAAGPRLSRSQTVQGFLIAALVASVGRLVLRWGWTPRAAGEVRTPLSSAIRGFGGGAYGTVALATWCYLQGAVLVGAWRGSRGWWEFLYSRSLDWFFGFGWDAFVNAARATVWPLFSLLRFGPLPTLAAGCIVWAADALGRRWVRRDEREVEHAVSSSPPLSALPRTPVPLRPTAARARSRSSAD